MTPDGDIMERAPTLEVVPNRAASGLIAALKTSERGGKFNIYIPYKNLPTVEGCDGRGFW